jgi:CBS-domain-containing membrane protein
VQGSDVMTREVVPVGPDTPAEVVAGHGFAAAPVVDGGRLGGIVSRRDLLRATVRPGEEVRHELLRRVEDCTGALRRHRSGPHPRGARERLR